MAKLAVPDKTTRVKLAEDVRRIRDRYAAALALGWSVPEASELSKGSGPLPKPESAKMVKPRPVTAQPAQPPAPTQSEAKPADEEVKAEPAEPAPELPPNWRDLPWPELRGLAVKLAGKQQIRSRREAEQAIEQALILVDDGPA